MLYLNVKVERALTPVDFLTVLVRTDVLPVNFLRCSSVMLFPTAILDVVSLLGRFLRFQGQTYHHFLAGGADHSHLSGVERLLLGHLELFACLASKHLI